MADEDMDHVLKAVAALSVTQLKACIDAAGLDRSSCVEKDDLRVLAVQAAAAGAPLPETAATSNTEAAASPVDVSDGGGPVGPDEKRELTEHWTEQALRIQLEMLGKSAASSASKPELVEAYWAHLVDTGAAFGAEHDRRWLRVDTLDKEAQARRFVEAVTGASLGDGAPLQEALRSGEVLCDFASVFLGASGKKALTPSRAADGASLSQAAASRLRAKQTENLSLYQAACLALGVAHSNTFNPDDLYEGKNIPSVLKNLHAVAQTAQRLVDYRGPLMGPVQRKDKTWTQRASTVATDWRRTATPGAGLGHAELLGKQVVKTRGMTGLGMGGEATFIGGAGVRAMAKGQSGEVRLGGVGTRAGSTLGALAESGAAAIAEEDGAEDGGATGEDATTELTPLEEILADPHWRDRYDFVPTEGMGDEEAALTWVRAVLAKHEVAPAPAGSLVEALGSGSALCRLLSAISPSVVKAKVCEETPKKFEQMAAVEAYLKGCAKLGVGYTFVTNDLHEGRDVRAVCRQLWALALHVRSTPALKATFRGPHLGTAKEASAAREAVRVREEVLLKEEKRMARERKRIERDMLSEEMEDERQLIEFLRRAEEEEIEFKKKKITEAKEAAQAEKERRERLAVQRASPSGFLYKRGGVAKLWRKRWFRIESGELSYWPAPEDEQAAKAPLGTLSLANASVRRPTDPKSKGKFQSTCLRLDLDPEAQISTRASAASVGSAPSTPGGAVRANSKSMFGRATSSSSVKGGGGAADDDDTVSSAGTKEKYKYLLAAESAQGMSKWMEAMEFWSRRHGTEARRSVIELGVTQEEAASLRAQAKTIPGVRTEYLQAAAAEEADGEEGDDADEAALVAAAEESATAERRKRADSRAMSLSAPAEKAELMNWSAVALTHNLDALGVLTSGQEKRALVDLYWSELEKRGQQHDDAARRWLHVPKEMDAEAQARLWIGCLLDTKLPPAPLQGLLRSGELLCELVNAIQPGIVAKVARAELLAAMSENRRNARMRENIGQYVDACAELGVPQRELFLTADLFENKNWKAVLRSIHGLARLCHCDIAGFTGPHIGIQKRGGAGTGNRLMSSLLSRGTSAASGAEAAVVQTKRM